MPCAGIKVNSGDSFTIIPCQFSSNYPENELMEVDGKQLCHFHAPLEDNSGNLTEKGKWRQDKNQKFYAEISELREKLLNSVDDQVLDLSGVVFPGYANFRGQQFPEVDFFYAQFSGPYTNFREAKFKGNVNFEEARFSARTDFRDAIFKMEAGFYHTKFRYAEFSGTKFIGEDADFRNAQFKGKVDFNKSLFKKKAFFTSPGNDDDIDVFQGEVQFEGTIFLEEVDFANRKFQRSTNFKDCIFHKAPCFHGCSLHQDTKFTDADFRDTKSDEAVGAYQTLKLDMENKRARQEQLRFYALEMKSRRHTEKRKLVKFLSWLYEVTSDYGQSISLPLIWLGLSLAVFAIIYAILFLAVPMLDHKKIDILVLTSRFSLEQMIRPFGSFDIQAMPEFHKKLSQANLLSLRLIAALQSFLSLILLLLSALATRWRFKIG
ncbi:MAG: pentapeptide repeat-containing protein [Nitrospinae bacterium]|nr:pentapeptide repeat-containing protein [Nitrospinota bacterium]